MRLRKRRLPLIDLDEATSLPRDIERERDIKRAELWETCIMIVLVAGMGVLLTIAVVWWRD